MARDPRLPIICQELLERVPCVKSIIICGSRASSRGLELLRHPGDYDIVVVMEAFLIPFYIRRIKAIEGELSEKFGVKVNLNPLPTFRMQRAKGNLFLFKLKREGVTVWGENYMGVLDPGQVKDITTDNYFSYLSSLIKDLIECFDPSFVLQLNDERSKQLKYSAAKAMLGCGELLLLLRGTYESKPKVILKKLVECEHHAEITNSDFLDGLHTASKIRENPFIEVDDLTGFWLSAKDRLLEMFGILMRHFFDSRANDLDELTIDYMKADKGASPLKNVEYSALTLLLRTEIFPMALLSRPMVVDRVRVALIWLLSSINEDGSVSQKSLEKAFHILKGYMRIRYSNDDAKLWRNIKCTICTYWPYASTVMGL